MSVRLVPAPISIDFEPVAEAKDAMLREFHQLSESDEDPIAQWLKRAKGRGETAESDPVLLNLVVELHRKIDHLEQLIKNETPQRLRLAQHAMIEAIGFTHLKLKEPLLVAQQHYYGRVDMPVHPRHDIAIFFTAEDTTRAKITKIHERDEKEWAAYLTARERVLIREMREIKR